ncbi:MAG: hypothetical protein ACD_44C00399G0008 [uncultured bacterium]|nr:MAG: hypothetical protein ACD_44C00399G0008 [uncultured bacterium]OGT17008.1 MAG: alkyl hydroperoxide reductase [Gammaproteobacteria bacterium RIFCSPHIGHO2_02_FULL_38_33]OGT23864.1 MAG: alkyl hydroperoxide reductase [Gammaproteobacteria bacterium RIFCSPHIGHO2_12_38_15]OGT69128.1 MAG: alkyl hydroperoxide reductase [Gammaproteobacteria bacterium RIFCSPLOWO2_02_FULL_38_11]OGT77724.1 MAG: alkyl hydroperoxide reductase [Gammaproteobacteria bacterium RIFCSPLOWO2_12_FULL_38_14]
MSVLVTRKAPDFCVSAVNPGGQFIQEFKFHDAIKDNYALLFFYPLDFTFVCPSELIALDHRMNEFKKRNVEVIAISIDSQFTHLAWRNTPVNKGGISQVKFTLAADIQHTVCQAYGIEHPEAGVALRAAFIIDPNGIVRSQIVNDLPIGRDIDELLRLIDAVQFADKEGEVCPAGWKKGATGMKPTTDGVAHYLSAKGDAL